MKQLMPMLGPTTTTSRFALGSGCLAGNTPGNMAVS
jgi:hypothetical protein